MKKLSEIEQKAIYDKVYPIAMEYRNSIISGEKVITDTFDFIEQLGIILLRFPAVNGNDLLSGFSIRKNPFKCIYINTNQNLGRQYMSCWHEMYHLITGEGKGISYVSDKDKDPIECSADTFAGIILMPDNLVKKYINDNHINVQYIRHIDIICMQNYFQVGYSAMVKRIIQLYPEYDLKNRYGLAAQSRRCELESKTVEVGGNVNLIKPTRDVYIPERFFINLKYNIDNKRISNEKAYGILKCIEGLNDGV